MRVCSWLLPVRIYGVSPCATVGVVSVLVAAAGQGCSGASIECVLAGVRQCKDMFSLVFFVVGGRSVFSAAAGFVRVDRALIADSVNEFPARVGGFRIVVSWTLR